MTRGNVVVDVKAQVLLVFYFYFFLIFFFFFQDVESEETPLIYFAYPV